MNITFLIGNGFDVNLGLKTNYTDFYDIYIESNKNRSADNPIKKFCDKIEGNYETWGDFETAFAENIDGEKDNVRDILYDFSVKFSDYLREETKKRVYSDNCVNIFSDFLKNGYKNLEKRDRMLISGIYDNCSEDIAISFVNFNYTDTLEKLINRLPQNAFGSRPLRTFGGGNKYIEFLDSNPPLTIHGNLKNGIIIGTDDLSQIKNENLKSIKALGKYCVKKDMNVDMGYVERENQFTYIINSSNIIYSYGVGFGQSDLRRWNIVSKWLRAVPDRKLIIYKYNTAFQEYKTDYARVLLDAIDYAKDEHLKKLGFNEDEYEKFYNQIFIIDSSKVLNFKLIDENAKSSEEDKKHITV